MILPGSLWPRTHISLKNHVSFSWKCEVCSPVYWKDYLNLFNRYHCHPWSISKSLLLFGLGRWPSLGWQIEVPAPRPAPTEPITLDTLQAPQPWCRFWLDWFSLGLGYQIKHTPPASVGREIGWTAWEPKFPCRTRRLELVWLGHVATWYLDGPGYQSWGMCQWSNYNCPDCSVHLALTKFENSDGKMQSVHATQCTAGLLEWPGHEGSSHHFEWWWNGLDAQDWSDFKKKLGHTLAFVHFFASLDVVNLSIWPDPR